MWVCVKRKVLFYSLQRVFLVGDFSNECMATQKPCRQVVCVSQPGGLVRETGESNPPPSPYMQRRGLAQLKTSASFFKQHTPAQTPFHCGSLLDVKLLFSAAAARGVAGIARGSLWVLSIFVWRRTNEPWSQQRCRKVEGISGTEFMSSVKRLGGKTHSRHAPSESRLSGKDMYLIITSMYTAVYSLKLQHNTPAHPQLLMCAFRWINKTRGVCWI